MSEQNYANVQQQAELMKYISDNMKVPVLGAGGGFAPIGFYGWSADYVTGAPQGWLRCEGQEVNIADYPELATFYASQHGASNYWGGDGITTFAVPDLRGEFIRGAGTNSHENQGSGGAVGEHQDGTEHPELLRNTSNLAITRPSTGYSAINNADKTVFKNLSIDVLANRTTGSTDSYQYSTSRPTNTSGVFFVKATLSDAEINAFNVYTPREHQVAWWEEEIDGVWKRKPVYERTVVIDNPATNWATLNDYGLGFIPDEIIDVKRRYNMNNTWYASSEYEANTSANGYLRVLYQNRGFRIYATENVVSVRLILRYTKSTDQWQTV